MQHHITAISGDGIGKEVIPATIRVLESLALPITVTWAEAGFGTFEASGTALPNATLAQCQASDAILFGATQSPMTKVEGYSSPILALRTQLGLYANLRPAKTDTIDMLIVRENTEGLYSRRERLEDDGKTAIAEQVITEFATRRIVDVACQQAMKRRQHLTIVHKANVLKETGGLFRRVAFDVARDYPDLTVTEQLVDACAMKMAMDATQYDVIVTSNLFGDILSDLAAGLTGGPGLAPSANIGEKYALFEPVHGSAPDIAGQGIADPRAAFLCLVMLLRHLGYTHPADRLATAIASIEHLGTVDATTQAMINHYQT
ncbi:MAG: isocitrate/isopropylmalate dehydrogenase family protein [Chloroflexota bacterium]